jgi:hypothetical protein
MRGNMADIHFSKFVVDETPYCLWDWDIQKKNLEFLNRIDPVYFRHIANIHGQLLETDERQYAAIALRTAYSHGLESLFALLFATIQAPTCVFAWLLKYEPKHIRNLITKINHRKTIISKLAIKPINWNTLASEIHSFSTSDPEKDTSTQKAFAKLWERFAFEFLDKHLSTEYNSIKHGLRIKMGGFHIEIEFEDVLNSSPSSEKAKVVGKSEFGSAFLISENLHNRHNLRVVEQRLNWNPNNLVHALVLISISIANIVAYLKQLNRAPADEIHVFRPTDDSYFEEP